MSDLNRIDKIKLEKLFEMSSGYVLNFSDKTFSNFFMDELKLNIDADKFNEGGSSKANRLRTFWRIESNYKVAKSIVILIEYYKVFYSENTKRIEENKNLIEECLAIANRIKNDNGTEQIIKLDNLNIADIDVELLLVSIRESIEKNEPVLALDRLHTYSVKYIRSLCDKHGISYDNNKPLHSCYGEYIKYLENNNQIETEMTKKILKFSISIFDSFNFVRNNKSFAHDNEILNYEESMLIYRSMTSILSFIGSIEDKLDGLIKEKEQHINSEFMDIDENDLPFWFLVNEIENQKTVNKNIW